MGHRSQLEREYPRQTQKTFLPPFCPSLLTRRAFMKILLSLVELKLSQPLFRTTSDRDRKKGRSSPLVFGYFLSLTSLTRDNSSAIFLRGA